MPIGVGGSVRTQPQATRGAGASPARTFMAGLCDRGPANTGTRVSSLTDFVRLFGDKVAYSELCNSVRLFFGQEPGAELYVSRAVGPAATVATIVVNDSVPAPSTRFDASSPGVWAAGWKIIIAAGTTPNTVLVTVQDGNGVTQESNDNLGSPAAIAAATWTYVRPVAVGANRPAVGTFTLAGGTDDRAAADWAAAINTGFPASLNTGVVIVPGQPYSAVVGTGTLGSVLKAHCNTLRRVCYLDLTATATVTDARNASTALLGGDSEQLAIVHPRPTVTDGTAIVSVPASAALAAKRVTAHRVWGPGRMVAGDVSILDGITGVTSALTDAEVSAYTDVYQIIPLIANSQGVMALGARSLSTVGAWRNHATADLVNVVYEGCKTLGEKYVMRPLDGRGATIARFHGELEAFLSTMATETTPNFQSAYAADGTIIDLGYVVETGPAVNTPTTLALGQLRAVISIRPLEAVEFVRFEIINIRG